MGQLFATGWNVAPSIPLGCAALLALYLGAVGFRPTRQMWLFGGGVAVIALALMSPIDTLGDRYLFSFHMVQHLLLILFAAPLLIAGIPLTVYRRLLSYRVPRQIERVLGQPIVAWIVSVATLWVWHAPAFYEAALQNTTIHVFQHLCFLVTAVIFWWPVVAPAELRRMGPLPAMVYLFAESLSSVVLGVILTFAQPGIYPTYLHPVDMLGILPMIQQEWGLTPKTDQELGGLIMWVPGGGLYLLAILGVLARWFSAQTAADSALLPREA